MVSLILNLRVCLFSSRYLSVCSWSCYRCCRSSPLGISAWRTASCAMLSSAAASSAVGSSSWISTVEQRSESRRSKPRSTVWHRERRAPLALERAGRSIAKRRPAEAAAAVSAWSDRRQTRGLSAATTSSSATYEVVARSCHRSGEVVVDARPLPPASFSVSWGALCCADSFPLYPENLSRSALRCTDDSLRHEDNTRVRVTCALAIR